MCGRKVGRYLTKGSAVVLSGGCIAGTGQRARWDVLDVSNAERPLREPCQIGEQAKSRKNYCVIRGIYIY